MDIDCDFTCEYFASVFYVKELRQDSSLCLVCLLDEGEDEKRWLRYELRCGHVFHTRCFRRWCGKKQAINCPYCGSIDESMANRYCSTCQCFGHNVLCDGVGQCPISRYAQWISTCPSFSLHPPPTQVISSRSRNGITCSPKKNKH